MRSSGGTYRVGALMRVVIALGAIAALFCAALALMGSAAAARKPVLLGLPRGSLVQLPGTHGCVSERHLDGCLRGRGLGGAGSVALSPDGRSVYVASNDSAAVASFSRDPSDGSLRQLGGLAGCVSESGGVGCTSGKGLRGAFSIAVSPDGRNVYVVSYNGVAAFARNRNTGALTQLAGSAACIAESGSDGCTPGRGLDAASSLTISPDGHNVYVASSASSAVAVFVRDPSTGVLRQLAGQAGCTSDGGTDGCQIGTALGGAFSVAVSPDGHFVYAGSLNSSAIVTFARSPGDGELSETPGAAFCTSEGGTGGCATGRGIDAVNGLAVSPDGGYLYAAASESSAVAALLRTPTSGAIDQLPGPYGCTSEGGSGGCATGRALGGSFALALSPDGGSLYVAGIDSVAAFSRNRSNGRLLQLLGGRGCLTERQSQEGCAAGRGLAGASSVAVSPDGKSVYVASLDSSSIAVFALVTGPTSVRAWLRGVPRRCVARPFTVSAFATSTLPLRSLRLWLDHRMVVDSGRDRLKHRIAVGRMSAGRHALSAIATDIAGQTDTVEVRFRRC